MCDKDREWLKKRDSERKKIEVKIGMVAGDIVRANPRRRARFVQMASNFLHRLRELQTSIEAANASTMDKWLTHWRFADEEFHTWLARFCEESNAEKRLGELLTEGGSPFEAFKLLKHEDRMEVIEEHRSICDAILYGSGKQIREAICHHLQMANDRRLRLLGVGF